MCTCVYVYRCVCHSEMNRVVVHSAASTGYMQEKGQSAKKKTLTSRKNNAHHHLITITLGNVREGEVYKSYATLKLMCFRSSAKTGALKVTVRPQGRINSGQKRTEKTKGKSAATLICRQKERQTSPRQKEYTRPSPKLVCTH